MKTFKNFLYAVIASALLTVGLTAFASSFDTASGSQHVQIAAGGPGPSCMLNNGGPGPSCMLNYGGPGPSCMLN